VTIETVAREKGLRFRPLTNECYDFAIPEARWERPAVAALRRLLEPGTPLRARLEDAGFGAPNN
jgi:molybdate-binding protein